MDSEIIELCAFWPRTSKRGNRYYTGQDQEGNWLMLFPVESENPRSPKFRLCQSGISQQEAHEEAGTEPNRFDDPDLSRQDEGPLDDDVPF